MSKTLKTLKTHRKPSFQQSECVHTLHLINLEMTVHFIMLKVKIYRITFSTSGELRQIPFLALKVPVPISLENEFSLNWQIWSLFLPKHHPW